MTKIHVRPINPYLRSVVSGSAPSSSPIEKFKEFSRRFFLSFLQTTFSLSFHNIETQMVSEELSHSSKKSSSNCLIMVPEFPQSPPFFKQPMNLKPHLQLLKTTASQVVSQFHSSITSTADKCFALMHMLVSKSPLLCKLLSFSSHLQSINNQIHFSVHNANLGSKASHNFAAILPGDSVAGIVVTNGILNFLNIYNTVLVLRLVLTWFPNAPPAIVSPLSTLCDPYLNIFRGFIPPLGGLDLSPILAFLVLNAFTSTASALPAELPSTGGPSPNPSGSGAPFTTSQRKWLKRITAINNSKTNSPGS